MLRRIAVVSTHAAGFASRIVERAALSSIGSSNLEKLGDCRLAVLSIYTERIRQSGGWNVTMVPDREAVQQPEDRRRERMDMNVEQGCRWWMQRCKYESAW